MLALKFPPINELIRWKDIFSNFNKVGLIAVIAALIGIAVFLLAARKDPLVAPTGIRNLAETGVTFIENDIVMQTMGKDGLPWTPFLLSLFIFVYLCNVPGIIPLFQMPATARMAIPLFLALVVWVIYNAVGFKHNGIKYITAMAWPQGVPVAMRPLVGVIELLSNIVLRPFSLAVRLFANMLAGHLILATFSIICTAVFKKSIFVAILPFSFALLFALTGFEILVSFLQAFIFTILTAVYIGGSMHPEH
jgi:F-type H+-transporting ATPase subunit a